jgi:hypothetical protein
MTVARHKAFVAAVNGELYVAGGHNNTSGAVADLERYDPATDSWSTLTPMPSARYQGSVAVLGADIYVIGGWDFPASTLPTSTLQIYDTLTDTWSTGPSLPTLSGGGGAGVINGKIYVHTPENGFAGLQELFHVFDPAGGAWSPMASLPTSHAVGAVGVVNDRLYFATGLDDPGVHALLREYDPGTNTWNTLTAGSTPRADGAGGVLGGHLLVAGGADSSSTVLNLFEAYDVANDTWSTLPTMPVSLAGARGAVIDKTLYVVGGVNAGVASAGLHAFVIPEPGSATLLCAAVAYLVIAAHGWRNTTAPKPVTLAAILRRLARQYESEARQRNSWPSRQRDYWPRFTKHECTWINLTAVTAAIIGSGIAVQPADAVPAVVGIDPRATYLLTNGDNAASAIPIELAPFGISPGDSLLLERLGKWDAGGGCSFDDCTGMVGVFSASDVLLSDNQLHRVQDAIDTGSDILTLFTLSGNVSTDIPEDFRISAEFSDAVMVSSVTVDVPLGATHLFVAAHDSRYFDNSDPNGNFALQITIVPEPGSALPLACGLIVFLIGNRRVLRASAATMLLAAALVTGNSVANADNYSAAALADSPMACFRLAESTGASTATNHPHASRRQCHGRSLNGGSDIWVPLEYRESHTGSVYLEGGVSPPNG